jgi:hypothetical protein
MIGHTLTLHRRPGKHYVHGADLFDALTSLYPNWRRARLDLQRRLHHGCLVLAAEELRPQMQPIARMELAAAGARQLAVQVLPMADHPAPASTQGIPEEELLADSRIHDLSCQFQHRCHSSQLGLTTVTAAIKVLRQLEPASQWLLAELDLPNPDGWPPSTSFNVTLRKRRLTGKFASFTLQREGHPAGSLHLARHSI